MSGEGKVGDIVWLGPFRITETITYRTTFATEGHEPALFFEQTGDEMRVRPFEASLVAALEGVPGDA